MSKYKYFPMHMHLHSCYQPGASMEGHMYHAKNLSMKYIWFTDHDIRMGKQSLQPVKFDFKEGELFFENDKKQTQGFLTLEDNVVSQKEKNEVSIVSHPEILEKNCMKITVDSREDHWQSAGASFFTSGKRHCVSLLAGASLSISVMLEEAADARIIFDITLSQRPPEHTEAHLLYVIGSVEGLKCGPHSLVIPLQYEGGFQKYTLQLSEDVLKEEALLHQVGGLDNAFDTITIKLEARNCMVSACVDDFTVNIKEVYEAVRTVQKKVAAEIGEKYGIVPFVATEISAAGSHKNCFSSTVPIIPYNKFGYKVSHEDAVRWVKDHDGIFALNHPFEKYKREVLDDEKREKCFQDILEEFLRHKVWGAHLMEVGFPMGRKGFELSHHLRLWDKLSEAGYFLTGYGSSDNHSNQSGWYEGNNFATWLGVQEEETEPVCEEAFIQAMKSGNVFTGDPVYIKGDIQFETLDGEPVGSVITVDCNFQDCDAQDDAGKKQQIVQFYGTHLKSGWLFKWIANGKTAEEILLEEEQEKEFISHMQLPTDKPVNFVRAELYNEDGRCILLTNPIYLRRKDL